MASGLTGAGQAPPPQAADTKFDFKTYYGKCALLARLARLLAPVPRPPCALQVLRRGVAGCPCAARLRAEAAGKWSLKAEHKLAATAFTPRQLFDFLHNQIQKHNPYNRGATARAVGKPRFMGDGLKMAKCLLQDRAIYVELRRMLVLHGGESPPVPISAVEVRLLEWQQMFTC